MATKKFKSYSEHKTHLLTEAAKWDDVRKKKIDAAFVSFDEKEDYEPRYLYEHLETILNAHGIEVAHEELISDVSACNLKLPRNHPRKRLMKCVLEHYGIEIGDVDL